MKNFLFKKERAQEVHIWLGCARLLRSVCPYFQLSIESRLLTRFQRPGGRIQFGPNSGNIPAPMAEPGGHSLMCTSHWPFGPKSHCILLLPLSWH